MLYLLTKQLKVSRSSTFIQYVSSSYFKGFRIMPTNSNQKLYKNIVVDPFVLKIYCKHRKHGIISGNSPICPPIYWQLEDRIQEDFCWLLPTVKTEALLALGKSTKHGLNVFAHRPRACSLTRHRPDFGCLVVHNTLRWWSRLKTGIPWKFNISPLKICRDPKGKAISSSKHHFSRASC